MIDLFRKDEQAVGVVEGDMRIIATCLIGLMLIAVPAHAATRYVDNSISDCASTYNPLKRTCGDGSDTSYNTLAEGFNATSGGDTLYIRGGTTYTESYYFFDGKSGSSYDAPTLIKGYPGDTRPIWKPSVSWSNNHQLAIGGGSTTSYVIFEGFEIDAANSTWASASVAGIYLGVNADHIKISDMIVRNAQFSNILCTSSAEYIWVTGSYIENGGRNVEDSDQEHGVYCAAPNFLLEYTEITLSSSAGTTSFSTDISGTVIRFNYIHDNAQVRASGVGIHIYNCTASCAVYGNIVADNGNGIVVSDGSAGTLVYNNTVSGQAGYGIELRSGSGHVARNNISVNNGAADLQDTATSPTKSNNLCDGGCDVSGGAPTFENAAAGDYRLETGSNGVDDGFTLGFPYDEDINGVARPQGSAFDVGAYEFEDLEADRLRLR